MQNRTTESKDTTDELSTQRVTTGADAVISALERADVEHVFGVQGGAIMPVYDALYDSELIHVTMAHEQSAAHAADAYGVVTGKPGVCISTSGPGATNLVTGLADANMDSDPVLALTGQVPTDLLGNDAFQETDTRGITNPITKASFLAVAADSVGDMVQEAFELAGDGRQGPTLVDLPKDITEGDTVGTTDSATQSGNSLLSDMGADEEVNAAADALERSEHPAILSGGGVIKGEACDELRGIATEHGIPVVTTMPGIGSFPEDHELAMEVAGMHGTGYANMTLQHCDVMLAVGTRFDDRLTGDIKTFAPDAELIHIDIDPTEISKNVFADYPLVGEASILLDRLHKAMDHSPDAREWREQCRQWKAEYSMDYGMRTDEPLKPQFIVETMDALTDSDAIVTTGVGQHQMWAMQYWTYRYPRTWISSHGLGTMGYGLPAAIGARFAAGSDQSVVCFEGDGSFLMTIQELSVAVRDDLDITVVVLNNKGVGLVKQWQDAFFDKRRMASEYPWVPRFDRLAEAFGALGLRLETYDQVEETLQAALDYNGPSIVDVMIDPEEPVYPMVPSGGDNTKFAMNSSQLESL